ncbi:MAG: cytochrome c biogenesis protein ResB [Phycisphaerae bacterium]|nr:cytochrome c biogenesis protein ResB [Phycisphaerae bacterium]
MNKFRYFVMWAALILLVVLIVLSIYGAFLGAADAQLFFNSLPLASYWLVLGYWLILGCALLAGRVSFRKLIKAPALLLIHSGCLLVLVGAMVGSEAGQKIQKKYFGMDKIRRGQMQIFQNQESRQVQSDSGQIKELPFSIRLKDFRIEYYKPTDLRIQNRQGNTWKIPILLNTEFDLGSEFGKVTILKQFRNFLITIDDGIRKAIDSNQAGSNPALEVQIEYPDGTTITRYVFERFQGHIHPEDKFLLVYKGAIRDFISDLAIIENGKIVAEKNVEVNHPLHFGGYYFYQHAYDPHAEQYTILMVVSDSGLFIVYAGYLLLLAGVFWHFWLKHPFKKQGCV